MSNTTETITIGLAENNPEALRRVKAIVGTIPISNELTVSLSTHFNTFLLQAEEMKEEILKLEVTSVEQKAEMKKASALRKKIKKVRTEADKLRKLLKEDYLNGSKAIQSIYNAIDSLVRPMEEHLLKQENFEANLIAKQQRELEAERVAILGDTIVHMPYGIDLGKIPDEDFQKHLDFCKFQEEMLILKAKKEKEERELAEKEEQIKQERFEKRISLASEYAQFFPMFRGVKDMDEELFEQKLNEAKESKSKFDLEQKKLAEDNEKAKKLVEEARIAEREAREAKEKLERAQREQEEKAAIVAREKIDIDSRLSDKEKILNYLDQLEKVELPELQDTHAKSFMGEVAMAYRSLSDKIKVRLETTLN